MNVQNKIQIFFIWLISIISSTIVYASENFNQVINLLTNPDTIQLTDKKANNMSTFWGNLKPGKKDTSEGIWEFFSAKQNERASAVFVLSEKKWLLNDFNVKIVSTEQKSCIQNYQKLSNLLAKKLGRPNAQNKNNEDLGSFWQLKNNKEWGIWTSIVMVRNQKTMQDDCAVMASLAFGADEYLSESNDF